MISSSVCAPHMVMVSTSSALQLGEEQLRALGLAAVHRRDEGAADEHRVRAQGQGLEHVHAGADAAVHED